VIGRSRLDPDKPEPYYNRGITNFYAGLLSQAAADFGRSSQLNPRNSYTAIWLDIVDARSNRPSQFARTVPQVEMTKWLLRSSVSILAR
jgi:lipoprotein NlpI